RSSPPMRGAQHLETHQNKDKEELDLDCTKKYDSVFKNHKEEEED
ncbi:hypothetical protein AVEN_43939-1, partial [Araneus ventricosus]